MQTKFRISILVYLVAVVCIPFHVLHADECDDTFAEAKVAFETANEAAQQENFEHAVELYKQAEELYGQVSDMKNCSSASVHQMSRNKAEICRQSADKYLKYLEELKLHAKYGQATEKFSAGNTHAQNGEWEAAMAAFEEAALIWESISAATQSENGKKASEAAVQARKAAESALDEEKKLDQSKKEK